MIPVQTLHQKELPINPAARAGIPPDVISTTVWSASPAGLTDGVDGALAMSLSDSTIVDREACADAAVPLP
jgi:hypothetical protein